MKKLVAIAVGAAIAKLLVPSMSDRESDLHMDIQRRLGTRREWQPPVWPDDMSRRGLWYAMKQMLLARLEPVFAMCRVEHPPV